ncbi:substrate-binding periplasmic protein [Thalassotalea euphylliae]|uniref:substrate-binding periplasmic protein n=1 Tax=Thalassotalea euphylliae TaxID=1655234 RepID=UPI00363810A2
MIIFRPLVFILVLLGSATAVAQQLSNAPVTITIAKPEQAYPPYHWLEDGEVKGLVPDIIAATSKAIGNVKVEYKVMPWKRMFELAKSGTIDAIMPINLNAERQYYLNFVSEPLIMERMNFVTTNAFDVDFSGNLNDISQFDVAGIAGYYYGEAYQAAKFNTIELPNEETQVKMLLAGRFPLALLDINILPFYINKLGGEKEHQVKVLEPHLYEAALHLAFAKNGKHALQAETFSQALVKLKSSEQYQDILSTHLTTAVD